MMNNRWTLYDIQQLICHLTIVPTFSFLCQRSKPLLFSHSITCLCPNNPASKMAVFPMMFLLCRSRPCWLSHLRMFKLPPRAAKWTWPSPYSDQLTRDFIHERYIPSRKVEYASKHPHILRNSFPFYLHLLHMSAATLHRSLVAWHKKLGLGQTKGCRNLLRMGAVSITCPYVHL